MPSVHPLSRVLIALVFGAASITPHAQLGFVGNLYPQATESTPRQVGSAGTFDVFVQVFKSGVTDSAGQGAGIACNLVYDLDGDATTLPMSYNTDIGANDEYTASLSTAALAAGNYAVTAWCTDDGGATQQFSQDGATYLSMTPVPTPPPGTALVQLFEWKYSDVAQECAWLAGKGYTGVQVSSPSEHRSHVFTPGSPWWVRYQPVSYILESRSGTPQDFADMVAACDAAGVDVLVDVVINHMSNAGSATFGTAGSFYFGNSYDYTGSHGPADFHYCGTNPGLPEVHDINDFSDRFQLQNCELTGLADIDTGAATPRATLVAYLQGLMDLGVDGFRVDAAKHIASSDLQAIINSLSPAPYVVQEVIDNASEDVRFHEYLPIGDVTEFDYGQTVGGAFLGCGSNPASLEFLGPGLYDSNDALVFTDNHDTQRGSFGCVITFESGDLYDLANVFMLAHPYGYPRVMSSYHFGSESQGPPAVDNVTLDVWVDGEPSGCNASDWVCEHRRPAIANTVTLRSLAGTTPRTDWWDDGSQVIAFGRGDRGYVAINAGASPITRTWSTSMAPGTYCNVARYEVEGDPATCRYPGGEFPAPTDELVQVDGAGNIVDYEVATRGALVIHADALVVIAEGDGDGIPDDQDNCSAAANPDQRDTNGDGFGNICDPDINNDGIVNAVDLGNFKAAFFSQPGDANWNPDADFNGNDIVVTNDLGILKSYYYQQPGPGALVPPSPPTCGAVMTGLDPAETFGDIMFLRGNLVANWAAVPGTNDFTNLGSDQYLVELQLSAGTYDYKVANDGWTIERSNIVDTLTDGGTVVLQDNGGGSPNSAVSVPESGCYSFSLDATDTAFPTLSMDRKF